MTATTGRSGFFRTVLDAIVESRQREADRHIGGVLLTLDDETLARFGYSRADLRKRPSAGRSSI